MAPGTVLELLSKSGMLAGKVTHEEVRQRLEVLSRGQAEANCVAMIAPAITPRLGPLHFAAVLQWIAEIEGLTYAECVHKLVSHTGAMRTKLENYFAEFGHGTAQGLMTVYEFTRFCHSRNLFSVSSRFVEGDVHFLFQEGGEGRAVDFAGFKRVLEAAAARLRLNINDFHLLLSRLSGPSRPPSRR